MPRHAPRSQPPPETTEVASSFDDFYSRHYARVLGLAYALSGNWATAEETAQEAFLRTYQRWDEVRAYDRPDAWVRTVAANLARSKLRRLGSEVRALARLHHGRDHRQEPHDPLPDELRRFWRAVRALPRRRAEVVVLHYLEDLSVRDVAEILGIAEGTVKAHLHRARASLTELLDTEVAR